MTQERKKYEQIFEVIASDPNSWLEYAYGMKMAAEPVLQGFLEILNEPQTRSGIRLKKLAYLEAYMLLIGFAFENLLKAIAVKRGLITVGGKGLKFDSSLTGKRARAGHGLTEIACTLQLQLTPEEQKHLKRIEEFSYWAGRYPIPKELSTYVDSHSGGNLSLVIPTDSKMTDRLFDKLSRLINNPK